MWIRLQKLSDKQKPLLLEQNLRPIHYQTILVLIYQLRILVALRKSQRLVWLSMNEFLQIRLWLWLRKPTDQKLGDKSISLSCGDLFG